MPDFTTFAARSPLSTEKTGNVLKDKGARTDGLNEVRHLAIEVVAWNFLLGDIEGTAVANSTKALARWATYDSVDVAVFISKPTCEGLQLVWMARHFQNVKDLVSGKFDEGSGSISDERLHSFWMNLVDENGLEP